MSMAYKRDGSKNPNWKGGKIRKECLVCAKTLYARIDEDKKGLGKYCSRKCYWESKKGQMPKNIQDIHLKNRGENATNWRGGVSTEHKLIRSSALYKNWRKSVYERDEYKCVWCGVAGNGKNLNADHIKPFAYYPEYRLEVSNGRTLCVDCHRKTDTYGKRVQSLIL